MYDMPFVPSDRPLVRHMSMIKNCLDLICLLHNDDDDAYMEVSFFIEMMNSLETCKDLWEQLRADALDSGLEPDDPILQMTLMNPYRYESR